MRYKYRVYAKSVNGGRSYGKYYTLEEAKAMFNELVVEGHEAVYLQELSLVNGWVERDIETHVTEEFKEREKAYWAYRAEQEEEWRAGDAYWKAPGMSIRDFI